MKLRPPRFSMRMLLIAMLVVGAVLGVVGQQIAEIRAKKQRARQILERLQAKGAEVYFETKFHSTALESLAEWVDGQPAQNPREIRFRAGNFETADFEATARLEGLEEVLLWHPETEDAWIIAIANSKSLKHINLASGRCTSKGAIALAESDSPLISLWISSVAVDDEFMRRVAQRNDLQSLGINGTNVTSNGLAELANAKALAHLYLDEGANLGGGFIKLERHPNLASLDFHSVWLEDTDLAALAGLNSVRRLRFTTGEFPKGLLRALASMPNLRDLDLEGSFHAEEDLNGVTFPKLETYSAGEAGFVCPGIVNTLAKTKSLNTLRIARTAITHQELLALAKTKSMFVLEVESSPSKEAIAAFQKAQPYCVYIDGQWGLFQPKVGINPARMGGGGIRKDSIVAPAGMK